MSHRANDIFISYSSKDREWVVNLAKALRDCGFYVWWDQELLPGDNFQRDIPNALLNSHCVITVFSENSVQSDWVLAEASYAHKNKVLIPVTFTDVVVPVPFNDLHEAALVGWQGDAGDPRFMRLLKSIRGKSKDVVPEENKSSVIANYFLDEKVVNKKSRRGCFIAIALSLTTILLTSLFLFPIWHSTLSTSSSGVVNITGDMSGSTAIGTQVNYLKIDTDAAQLIAKSLLQNSSQTSSESLQQKEEVIKQLTETVARLQQQPSDELKQNALKKLEEGKPEEAAQLLKQSLMKRGKALQLQYKQMSEDWVDVGNIAYLNNSHEAFNAYSKAVGLDPTNIEALNQLGNINYRLGNVDESIRAYETVLTLAGDDQSLQATAYGNLGVIYQTQGELDKAEEFLLKAFKIHETLSRQKDLANDYSNLGAIYRTQGELDKAEEFHLKALKINETLKHQEGIVTNYGNLGRIYQIRGELDKAEEFHHKALKINEILSHQIGIATNYGDLGVVYQARGELGKAEEFHLKALKIHETLSHQLGIANQYENLGVNYRIRGELDKAEEFHLKALKIHETLGRQEGIANQYGSLGLVHLTQGKLDKAEESLFKALKIDKALGRQEGMASGYGNLGLTYLIRGELDKAEEFLLKALKIDEALGLQEGMANKYGSLGAIYQARGELKIACGHWLISRNLFDKVGSATTELVQSWIDRYCSS